MHGLVTSNFLINFHISYLDPHNFEYLMGVGIKLCTAISPESKKPNFLTRKIQIQIEFSIKILYKQDLMSILEFGHERFLFHNIGEHVGGDLTYYIPIYRRFC